MRKSQLRGLSGIPENVDKGENLTTSGEDGFSLCDPRYMPRLQNRQGEGGELVGVVFFLVARDVPGEILGDLLDQARTIQERSFRTADSAHREDAPSMEPIPPAQEPAAVVAQVTRLHHPSLPLRWEHERVVGHEQVVPALRPPT